MALTLVKLWVLGFTFTLIIAIGWGLYNVIRIDSTVEDRGVRFLGIFFCCLLLFIVELPVRGMFAYNRVIKEKSKPSLVDRLTAAVFGKTQPIRPDYIYLILWVVLLTFSLRQMDSTGILNTRPRCAVDPSDAACQDPINIADLTRVTGDYGLGLGHH